MLNKLPKPLMALCLIAIVIGLIFLANGLILAWTEPTSAPPTGNVPTPLNIGSTTQTKDGGLNILGNLGIGTTNPQRELHVKGHIETKWGKVIASGNRSAIAAIVAGAYCQAKHATNYNIYAVRRDLGTGSCQSACRAYWGGKMGNYTGNGIGDLTCTIYTDANGDVYSVQGRPNSGYVEADVAYCDWCCCLQN